MLQKKMIVQHTLWAQPKANHDKNSVVNGSVPHTRSPTFLLKSHNSLYMYRRHIPQETSQPSFETGLSLGCGVWLSVFQRPFVAVIPAKYVPTRMYQQKNLQTVALVLPSLMHLMPETRMKFLF
jgi:hypothetical protein